MTQIRFAVFLNQQEYYNHYVELTRAQCNTGLHKYS